MTARHRLFLSAFRIVVFLMIALGISPSTERESAEGSNATASAPHDLLPISIQEAQANKKECLWDCTCQYYSDRRDKWGRKNKWAGEWHGVVKAEGRGEAEATAHEKCESETASQGVDCKWRECSCGNPRPKGRCE